MKKFTYSLIPIAVLLLGACATSILGFLVIVLTSVHQPGIKKELVK
jgi:hypothetical protein